MTVSSTATRVTYTGNGVTTAFATTFPFFAASEIEVIERVIATGAEALKVLITHYTVNGGNGATGTVTATGGAPSSSVQWIIRRKTARTQEIDYTPNDPFPAETHEQGLDRLKMNVQELGEENDRALKFPKTDAAGLSGAIPSSVARAGKFLAFDAAGEPIAAAAPEGGNVVSTFVTTLLDDADAAAFLATLGVTPIRLDQPNTWSAIQTYGAAARLANNVALTGRNNANSTDVPIATVTNADQVKLGDSANAHALLIDYGSSQIASFREGGVSRINVGAGLYAQGVSGGDKGVGSMNVDTYWRSGKQFEGVFARCVFNGTGTPAFIGTPFNFSSITDNGTGDFTLTFTNPAPSTAFAVAGSIGVSAASVPGILTELGRSTGSIRIGCNSPGTGAVDVAVVSVIVSLV